MRRIFKQVVACVVGREMEVVTTVAVID
jgi:hypothetical protein